MCPIFRRSNHAAHPPAPCCPAVLSCHGHAPAPCRRARGQCADHAVRRLRLRRRDDAAPDGTARGRAARHVVHGQADAGQPRQQHAARCRSVGTELRPGRRQDDPPVAAGRQVRVVVRRARAEHEARPRHPDARRPAQPERTEHRARRSPGLAHHRVVDARAEPVRQRLADAAAAHGVVRQEPPGECGHEPLGGFAHGRVHLHHVVRRRTLVQHPGST